MTQGFGEPDACLVRGDRLCGGVVKPRLGRIGKVFTGVDVLFEFDEPIGLRGSRHGVVIVAGDEEFVNAKTILSHHGFRRERGVEDLAGILTDVTYCLFGAHGGRRANEAHIVAGGVQPVGEPAQQAGQVGALRAVESMQFVYDEVFERVRIVAVPNPGVFGAHQQVVEHLVVGEQDVRRVFEQLIVAGHDVGGGHGVVVLVAAALAHLAHIHARGHVVAQFRTVVDEFCQSLRLVGGEGVHRIDEDGFDALASEPALPITVVEDWVQEAFGLA